MTLTTDISNLQANAALFRTLPCTITRSGVLQSGTPVCRVMPSTGSYQPVPGSVLLSTPTWELFLPPGTDVRPDDVLAIASLGTTYGVTDVLDPRSYEIERIVRCYLLTDSAHPSGGAFLPDNAVVSVKRGTASPHYTNRSVYLENPTRTERIMAAGAEVPSLLCDLPDADYVNGDVVTIVSVAGHTVVPHPQALRVGVVERAAGPPPLTSVQLTGIGGYA